MSVRIGRHHVPCTVLPAAAHNHVMAIEGELKAG